MFMAALADGRAVDYESFLNRYIEDQEGNALSICHPEQARTTERSESASKDPENVSSAMPIQGVLTGFGSRATATRCNRPGIAGLKAHFRASPMMHRSNPFSARSQLNHLGAEIFSNNPEEPLEVKHNHVKNALCPVPVEPKHLVGDLEAQISIFHQYVRKQCVYQPFFRAA